MKFSALVASALIASAAAADYIMWNAPSVSFDDPALWANPDGTDVSPFGEDLDNDAIASVSFGQQDQALSVNVPSGKTLTGGLKITLNGMTKLVLGDGKSKSTIKLEGDRNGAELTYYPGSDQSLVGGGGDRKTDKFDVNCRTNWVVVDSNGDLKKGPNGGVQYPTRRKGGSGDDRNDRVATGMYDKNFMAVFNNDAKMYNAAGEAVKRDEGMIFATKQRNADVGFQNIFLGESKDAVKVNCGEDGAPPVVDGGSFGEAGVKLDLGMCNDGLYIGGKADDEGTQESSCEPEAIFSLGGDDDVELFKVGDDFIVINGDGEAQTVTPTFTDKDGDEVDPADGTDDWVEATGIKLTVTAKDGTPVELAGPHGRGAAAITTSSTITTVTATTVTTTTTTTTTEEETVAPDSAGSKGKGNGASGGGSNPTGVIVAVVVVLLLVIVAAVVYVKKSGGGGGSAAAGGVVSFENPMYDDAKGQTNPTYAQAGGQAQSGYMDVPAGGGGGQQQQGGYMDVSPNAGGDSDFGGGGAGYMDVAPNAGGGGGSSGYMDVGGAGDGGYMDGSDGEEDV